ncbi:MAG: tetratricopeptide repeat protein [Bacteroidota bacterium]
MKAKKGARRKVKARPNAKRSSVFFPLILFVLAWIFYGNTLTNGYNFDDHLVTNEHFLTKQGIKGIPEIFRTPFYHDGTGITFGYRPMTVSSFAIEHQFFGDNSTVSHFINVLLYALTGVLIFLCLQLIIPSSRVRLAFLTALFFVIHPIHSEAVNNIKSRDELLALLFSISAIYAFLKGFGQRLKPGWLIAGFLCFLVGILSKLSALPFVVLIPLVLVLFREISIARLGMVCTGIVLLSFIAMPDMEVLILLFSGLLSLVVSFTVFAIKNAKLENGHVDIPGLKSGFTFDYQDKDWVVLFGLIAAIIGACLLPSSPVFVGLAWFTIVVSAYFFDDFVKNIWPMFISGLFMLAIAILNSNTSLQVLSFLPLLFFLSNTSFELKRKGNIQLAILISLLLIFHVYNQDLASFIPIILFGLFLFLGGMQNPLLQFSGIGLFLASSVGSYLFADLEMSALFLCGAIFIGLGTLKKSLPISRFRITMVALGIAGLMIIATSVKESLSPEIIAPTGEELIENPVRVLGFSENPLVYERSRTNKVASSFGIIGAYIKLLVFPAPLRYYYGYDMIPVRAIQLSSVLAFILALLAAWFGLINIRKNKLITFSLLLLFGGLFQFSNLFFPVAGIMGERLMYTASLGFCLLLAILLIQIESRFKKSKTTQYALRGGLLLLITLSFLQVFQRNQDWKDAFTLFSSDMPKLENSAKAHNLLAAEYLKISQLPENQSSTQRFLDLAIQHYESCIAIYPKFPYAYFDLGNAFAANNLTDKALENYLTSVEVDTHNGEAFLRIASIYESQGNIPSAIEYYRIAMEKPPRLVDAFLNLSSLYFTNQDFENGLNICQEGLNYFPNHPGLLNNTGNGLANAGAYKDAARYFETLLAQSPGDQNVIQKIILLYEQSDEPGLAAPFRAMLQ